MTTTDANGNLHDPRGLFSSKDNTEAPDGIVEPQPAPSAAATLIRQVWRGDDAIDVGSESFDVTIILDTMALYEVESLAEQLNYDDRDRLYEEAIVAGLVERHDGPTTILVNEWDIEDYLTYRRDNNLVEPTRDDFPLSQKAQDAHVGRALHRAYEAINVTELFADATVHGPSVKAQFERAFNHLYWAWKSTQLVEGQFRAEDQAAYERIEAVANRPDDVHRRDPEAQLAAVTLMEWLLKRDAVLAERSTPAP
jgi:hypothetical protein